MTMMNLTGAAVTVRTPDGRRVEYQPLWPACRMEEEVRPAAPVEGLPAALVRPAGPVGLPGPHEGTSYLVPDDVARWAAAVGRRDVYALAPAGTALWRYETWEDRREPIGGGKGE